MKIAEKFAIVAAFMTTPAVFADGWMAYNDSVDLAFDGNTATYVEEGLTSKVNHRFYRFFLRAQ